MLANDYPNSAVLNGARDYLGSAGAILVNQDSNRQMFMGAGVIARQALLLAVLLLDYNYGSMVYKRSSNVDRHVQQTAGVVAQIEDESAHSLLQQHSVGLVKLGGALFVEFVQQDMPDLVLVIFHPVANGWRLDVRPDQMERNGRHTAFSHDRYIDLRA